MQAEIRRNSAIYGHKSIEYGRADQPAMHFRREKISPAGQLLQGVCVVGREPA
jgi:hypothetical protein